MSSTQLTWQEAFENETPVYIEFESYGGHISWVYGKIVGLENELYTDTLETCNVRIDVDLGDGFADISAKDIVSIAPSRRRITDGN